MDKPKAPYRPKRAALNWIDLLVIAATVLTFVAVVAANNPHARAQTRTSSIQSDLPAQPEQLSDELNLIRAKIRLATSGPWG